YSLVSAVCTTSSALAMSPETSSAATRTSAARCTITNSVNSRSRSAGHFTGTRLPLLALALNTHVDTPHTEINSVHVACRTRRIEGQTRSMQSPTCWLMTSTACRSSGCACRRELCLPSGVQLLTQLGDPETPPVAGTTFLDGTPSGAHNGSISTHINTKYRI